LELRATLSADFLAPGPPSGQFSTPANGRTPPYAGQVIPGFSGMVDNGDGTFWAMPDNGFGAKGNSSDFLLRLYHITPRWESSAGGPGTIDVGEFISLRDPAHLIPFQIVNGTSSDRLLTGDDFDIESVVRVDDGTFWIGEEFGPFLLHVDASGVVLAPPVPFPGGKSPQNPTLEPGEVPRVPRSRGFEAMAVSKDERFLYPIVEGGFTDDPIARRRFIYEFDLRARQYTGRTWQYETDTDANLVGDAFTTGRGHMVIIEQQVGVAPAPQTPEPSRNSSLSRSTERASEGVRSESWPACGRHGSACRAPAPRRRRSRPPLSRGHQPVTVRWLAVGEEPGHGRTIPPPTRRFRRCPPTVRR
jgi:glycerophosphoryl diester phosphodiesterase